MKEIAINPAEQAAVEAQSKIQTCLEEKKCFLLEAGAGAGKTYSLIETLKYLIKQKGNELLKNQQQIACITYTNVAVREIEVGTDSHPIIHSSTIHGLFWSFIRSFQPSLRDHITSLTAWANKLEEEEITIQEVIYDAGYRKISDKFIWLHHDDVITLSIALLNNPKFRNLFTKRYPIVFIDEYQDTNADLINSLKTNFLDHNAGPLIGFFGDHWQTIYDGVCGKIEHPNLEVIPKRANFRSVPIIIRSLNAMRTELQQQEANPEAQGTVSVYHTNTWPGERQTGNHWRGDLPNEIAHQYLENLKARLETDEWDFSPKTTQILMLTHRVLASEQGYNNLLNVFRGFNDSLIKKEDRHIKFFVDTLEPVCLAYQNRRFGEMFSYIGKRTPLLNSHQDKLSWANDMDQLLDLRENGTIGEVVGHLKQSKRPRLSASIEDKEQKLELWLQNPDLEVSSSIKRLRDLKEISYKEVISLTEFINGHTPFITKHSTKGAQFENVLIVLGRGWNRYNFSRFLENAIEPDNLLEGERASYERNRNLFYVACSRAKKRLTLLFTQELSNEALITLTRWFGEDSIHSMPTPN